jgi:hypothetical protein
MTKVAVYDNPATYCREGWVDGKMTMHVTAEILTSKGFNGHRCFPFQLNVGKWREGQILGDPGAIQTT